MDLLDEEAVASAWIRATQRLEAENLSLAEAFEREQPALWRCLTKDLGTLPEPAVATLVSLILIVWQVFVWRGGERALKTAAVEENTLTRVEQKRGRVI